MNRPAPRRLEFRLFGDIDPTPRKDWLVSRLIGAGGELSCLYGPPGSFKSGVAGDLAAHVAAGRDWCGRRVTQGTVLYVACERAGLVMRRFAAWRQYHRIDELPLAITPESIDLKTPADALAVIACAHELADQLRNNVALIVIDTASRALAGGDENSSKDMGAFVGSLDRIQKGTGAHVMVLHHVPLDNQQRMRGHGALLGACDTTIGLSRSGDVRIATVDKCNDGNEGERVAFSIESVELYRDPDTGEPTTAPVAVPVEGDVPTAASTKRKLSDKQRVAMDCLTRAIDDAGEVVPETFGLPCIMRGVKVDTWRDEMETRGALGDANPRQDFKRISQALQARQLIAQREGLVWRAGQ
jgi:hypothetical protein